MSFFVKIFRFLSSLKLAVIVLTSFAYVLALGTVQESLHGTPYAKEAVYNTWWFELLLLVLGINVLCAALSRFPWKKHHTGFVVTHAGILIILLGSFVTQKWGIDGSIALAEGETSDRITLDEPLLQVASVDEKQLETWRLRLLKNPPSPENPTVFKMKDGTQVKIDQYYPNTQMTLNVKEGKEENPALKVVLSGLPMGADQLLTQWLFLKDNDLASSWANLGPAKLSFLNWDKFEKLGEKKETGVWAVLKLRNKEGKEFKVALQNSEAQEVQVEGSEYKIKIERYLPDARVIDNKLVSKSNEAHNPALEFKISSNNFEESHLVFANFPDLEAVHGKKPEEILFKAQFVLGAAALDENARGELFFAQQNNELYYRIKLKGLVGAAQKVKLKEEVATGWMTIKFKVEEYFSKANAEPVYRNVPLPPGKSGGPSAIRLKIEKDNISEELWMAQGDVKELVLNGVPYLVRYGLKAKILEFQLRLDDFNIERYPGTTSPKSYESLATVNPDKPAEKFQTKIFMNNPLQYKGYTVFQSSYQEGKNGEPDVSVFMVGKDPGTPVKYLGSFMMVCGIALMFWFKPLFIQKRITKKEVENLGN